MSVVAMLEQRASQAAEVHGRVREVLASVTTDQWSGQAADAWRARVEGALTDLVRVVDQLDLRATTLRTYVVRVRDIEERAWPWRRDLIGDGAVACSAPAATPWEQEQVEEADRTARWRLADLADERRSADRVASGGLDPLVVGQWVPIGDVLISAGIVTPAQITGDAIAAAMARRIPAMLDAGLTDQDARTLREFLDQWLADPAAMSALFTGIGGERTSELIDELGRGAQDGDLDGQAALALAVLIQQGLAVGSRDWDRTTATTFVHGLVEDPGAAGVVHLLLTGESAMGQQLTLAVAVAVDDAERLGYGEPWAAQTTDGGWVLTRLRDGEDADLPGGIAEIVLRSLAQHPDATLDWLVGGEERSDGTSRIDYWFGTRDWADGFETVAGLWSVAQSVSGGPASGVEDYDPARWEALVGANQEVFAALDGNEWFEPGRLSENGRAWLIDAIGAQLPEVIEKSVYAVGEDGVDGVEYATIPGVGSRLVPVLELDDLARVLGVLLHGGDGLTRFDEHVTAYQAAMLGAVGQPDGLGALGVIERAAAVQGLIDGATGGTDLSIGAAQDRRTGVVIAGAQEVLGLGSNALPGAGGVMAGPAISAGGTIAENLWATAYEQAVAKAEAENLTQEEAVRITLRSLLTAQTTPEMLTDADRLYGNGATIDDQIDRITAQYQHLADAAQGHAS